VAKLEIARNSTLVVFADKVRADVSTEFAGAACRFRLDVDVARVLDVDIARVLDVDVA